MDVGRISGSRTGVNYANWCLFWSGVNYFEVKCKRLASGIEKRQAVKELNGSVMAIQRIR